MFKPVNRHILVEIANGKEAPEPLIVLPEDFKPAMEKYAVVNILNFADDIRFELKGAASIVVDQSMIEEIVVNKTTYSVIQDNYVIGIVT
jgi:co-chaperonin GroES (HSP10)